MDKKPEDTELAAMPCPFCLTRCRSVMGEDGRVRHLPVQHDSRWIPVTERLPKELTAVMTYGEYSHVIGEIRMGDWSAVDGDSETGEPWIRGTVTHWMPLPEPPTPVPVPMP